MKKLFFPLFIFISGLLLSSCSSDSSNAADLFCENSKLKKDLQAAMDKQDDELIEEISTEIHENNSELEEIFIKYSKKDNPDKFYEELYTALESCESISKEEIEQIKQYVKDPKVKMPKRRRRSEE